MNHVQEILIGWREPCRIKLEYPVNLIRPAQFAAQQIQFPTAQTPHSLRFIEQILIVLQLDLSQLALGHIAQEHNETIRLRNERDGHLDINQMPVTMAVPGFKTVRTPLDNEPNMRRNLFRRLFYGLEFRDMRADNLIPGIASDTAIGVIGFDDAAGLIHLPESFTRGVQHHPQFTECFDLMMPCSLKLLLGLFASGDIVNESAEFIFIRHLERGNG